MNGVKKEWINVLMLFIVELKYLCQLQYKHYGTQNPRKRKKLCSTQSQIHNQNKKYAEEYECGQVYTYQLVFT